MQVWAKSGWLVALEGLIETTLGTDSENSWTAERGAVSQEQATWKPFLRGGVIQTQDE